jgi:hypothetical protein
MPERPRPDLETVRQALRERDEDVPNEPQPERPQEDDEEPDEEE